MFSYSHLLPACNRHHKRTTAATERPLRALATRKVRTALTAAILLLSQNATALVILDFVADPNGFVDIEVTEGFIRVIGLTTQFELIAGESYEINIVFPDNLALHVLPSQGGSEDVGLSFFGGIDALPGGVTGTMDLSGVSGDFTGILPLAVAPFFFPPSDFVIGQESSLTDNGFSFRDAHFSFTLAEDFTSYTADFTSMIVLGGGFEVVTAVSYDFQQIDHPGTPGTSVFGINDPGDVVGNGFNNVSSFPFVYESRTGTLTGFASASGFAGTNVVGIADSGVMVGSVTSLDLSTTSGMIRGKDGTFTFFSHPEAPSFTQARAVNNKGLVSGFRDISPDFRAGFIYDPKTDTFTDVVPGRFTVQHGINSKGEVVGNTIFFNGEDPCGSPDAVNNGWLRAVDGSITYFQVNGEATRARGINDAGSIVGFVNDSASGKTKGFVVTLDGAPCQSLTVAGSDLLEFPGFDITIPEGITNSGVIVGIVIGADGIRHGFIATPR